MTTLIIANPASGGYNPHTLEKTKNILKRKFGNVSVVLTERAGHAAEIAAAADADFIIAAGGDGLANEAAQGLAGTSKLFSVLPFGTANVFCCEYGIGLDPVKAAKKMDLKNKTRISAGYLDERLFLLMVGFGFDAETVKRVHSSGKKYKFKKLAHILNGCVALLNNNFKPFEVFSGGSGVTAYHLIVSVAACYGGKYRLGKIQPGRLNLFSVPYPGIRPVLKSVLSIALGMGFSGVTVSSDYVKVRGASCCQIDGEFMPIEKTSVFIKIKRNALNLVY